MGRLITVLGLMVSIVVALAVPAVASKPSSDCPAEASGWVRVDGEGWWEATVAGILEEGLTVEGEAERFGFGDDVDAFKAAVIENIFFFDKNDNGYICMQDLPNTPGLGAFIINAVDDMSSANQ